MTIFSCHYSRWVRFFCSTSSYPTLRLRRSDLLPDLSLDHCYTFPNKVPCRTDLPANDAICCNCNPPGFIWKAMFHEANFLRSFSTMKMKLKSDLFTHPLIIEKPKYLFEQFVWWIEIKLVHFSIWAPRKNKKL